MSLIYKGTGISHFLSLLREQRPDLQYLKNSKPGVEKGGRKLVAL